MVITTNNINITGAMLGGSFLPEAQFKSVLRDLIQQNQNYFLQSLLNVENGLKSNNFQIAYQSWEIFQTQVLKNPKTKTLAILNYYDRESSPQKFSLMDEFDTITPSGKISITRIKENLDNAFLTGILSKHLSGLHRSIKDNKISSLHAQKIAQIAGEKGEEKIKQRAYAAYSQGKVSTYLEIIYNNNRNGVASRGQIADAFINHLIRQHGEIFKQALESRTINKLNNLTTVFQEEGENFASLLIDSVNNIGWWTGGDAILTNSEGQVILNLQVKSSGNLGESIGQLHTSQLIADINQLILQFKTGDLDIFINKFYELLKTSAAMNNIKDNIAKTAERLARQALNIK